MRSTTASSTISTLIGAAVSPSGSVIGSDTMRLLRLVSIATFLAQHVDLTNDVLRRVGLLDHTVLAQLVALFGGMGLIGRQDDIDMGMGDAHGMRELKAAHRTDTVNFRQDQVDFRGAAQRLNRLIGRGDLEYHI